MSKKIRKPISVFTSITTIVWLSGVALLAPISVGAVVDVVDGDLIRNPNAEGMAQFDIYIAKLVGDKKFKRLILSPHVFESYEHFDKNGNGDNWDDVIDVDQATMDSCETTDLVREDGYDKVYRLYAAEGADTGTRYWLDMTADDFLAVFDADAIYTINATDVAGYTAGADVADASADFPPADAVSEGTLSVTLSADTPASGVAAGAAARLPFTKVDLTASGGDVVVDQIVVQRTGTAAQDGSLSSLDIIDADTNLPISTNSKSLNSLHQATFNDDVTVADGTTKSLILAANMAARATLAASYSGEVPSLSVASMTLKDDATLNATFPITGNAMTINGTIIIGSATIERGAYTNASSSSIQVGKTGYTFFSFKVTAGSVEKVEFSQIKVYQQGSASFTTDMENIKLYEEGVFLADAVNATSKYATFSFDPITLNKGQVKQFQVKADVADGSSRTIDLGIYRTTDLLVHGLTYEYNITPSYSGTGSSGNNPVMSDNEFTISNGTLQVRRSNTVGSTNIGVANDQVLGAFEFVCKGEEIDISALTLTVVSSTSGTVLEDSLSNVELLDADGNVVAGPDDVTNNALTIAWTDTFTVPVGTSIYRVRADLSTSGGWSSDDTIYVQFTPSAMTTEGVTTGNSITPTPSSAVSSNTQTIKAAALVITRNTLPANQSIITNQKDVVLSAWTFDASNSGEDIRVTAVGWTAKAAGRAASNTDALTVYVGGEALSPINDAVTAADATFSTAQSSTFAFDDPFIIAKGEKVTVELKGDKSTVSSNETENWGLRGGDAVTAYGVSTGNQVTESLTDDDGPTLTSRANGELTIDTEGNPASAIVLAGSKGNVFEHIKLSAKYEDIKLNQLTLGIFDGGYGFTTAADTGNEYKDVQNVAIYDGTTKLTEANITSAAGNTFYFNTATSPELIVPKGGYKKLTIKLDMGKVDPDNDNAPGTNSSDIKVYIVGNEAGIKSTGASSNTEITGSSYEVYRSASSSAMILRSSKPVIQYSSSSAPLGAATALTNGSVALFAYKVTADSSGGNVLLFRNTFVFATSGSGMTITNVYIKDSDGNTVKSAADPTPYNANNNSEYYYTATFDNPDYTFYSGATDESIQITSGQSETFEVWGTVAGAGTGENVSTLLVGDTASTSAGVNTTNAALDTKTEVVGRGWKVPAGDLTTQVSNFIWSDNYKNKSLTATGANAVSTTAMWYNGHLVSGLGNVVTTTSYVVGWSS